MRIYISGQITDSPNYMTDFAAAELMLTEKGHSVVNPAKVLKEMPEDTNYDTYMNMSMEMLKSCDAIYMLKGWKNSRGANREYGYALGAELEIYGGQDV